MCESQEKNIYGKYNIMGYMGNNPYNLQAYRTRLNKTHTLHACRLHSRRRVHCVPEDAELGQLGSDEARDNRTSVDAHSHPAGLAIVGHDDCLGTPQKSLDHIARVCRSECRIACCTIVTNEMKCQNQ